jgi:tetratricopeptide (TPR) repeat protein
MSVIDFSTLIAERTKGFTGREWVFQTIDAWLACSGGSRFFLLSGKPGSGKTAMAARLSQISHGKAPSPHDLTQLTPNFLSAHHFCEAYASLRVDPRSFSESIALQLAAHHQAYARVLANVGDKNVNMSVHQKVGKADVVQGVVIENLDLSGLNPQEGFNRAVLDPLRIIYYEGFDEPITILVDALDESLAHTGRLRIVELLSALEDLPAKVRFILTTRQDERVENEFRDAQTLFISASTFDEQNREDICNYVQKRLNQEEALSAKTAQSEPGYLTGLAETITNKAAGNFLYVGFLLDAIAGGYRAITELEGLPEGLDGLYYDSLNRVVKLGGKAWTRSYAPLLGVLSVAQTSLTHAQLEAFTGQSEEHVWQHLGDLWQFIEELEPTEDQEDDEYEYRIYHQSVVDFLHHKSLVEENRRFRNSYYLPKKEQHQRIISYYQAGVGSPKEVDLSQLDLYGLFHLAYHLHEAGYRRELYALLTSSPHWMNRKFIAFTSDTAYVADLDLALSDFSDPLTADDVPMWVKLHTARHVVNARVSSYSDTALQTLVWLGRGSEAVAQARLRHGAEDRFRGLLAVYDALREREQSESSLLSESREVARSIEDNFERQRTLSELAKALAKAWRYEEAEEVAHSIEDNEQRSRALGELARALAKAGDENRANALFDEAEEVARSIEASPAYFLSITDSGVFISYDKRSRVLKDLAKALAEAERYERAQEVARSIEIGHWSSKAHCELEKALAQAGRYEEAQEVARSLQEDYWRWLARRKALMELPSTPAQAGRYEEAEEVARSHAEEVARSIREDVRRWGSELSEALGELAKALAKAGDENRANALFDEAEEVARSIEDYDSQMSPWAFRRLAEALAQAGCHEKAEEVAHSIEDNEQRSRALIELARALAKAGDENRANALFDEAEEVARSIEKNFWQMYWRRRLAEALAQVGRYEKAQEVARSMEDNEQRSGALIELARALAKAGDENRANALFDEAQEVARPRGSRHDDYYRSKALSDVAEALAQAGCYEKAQEVALSIEDNLYRSGALIELARALAKAGDENRANALFDEAQEVAPSVDVLSDVAEALAQAGRYEKGLEVALSIEHNYWRAKAFSKLVKALAQTGRYRAAKVLALSIEREYWRYWRAWEETLQAKPPEEWLEAVTSSSRYHEVRKEVRRDWRALIPLQAVTLGELAEALAQAERYEDAEEIARSLEIDHWRSTARSELKIVSALGLEHRGYENARSLENNEHQSRALGELAKVLAQAGDENRANALFDEAEEIARSIESNLHWVRALGELAKVLAQAGDENRANALFDETEEGARSIEDYEEPEEVARSIEDYSERRRALIEVAKVLAQARRYEKAQEVALSIHDDYYQSKALIEVTKALVQAGRYEKAQEVARSMEDNEERQKALIEVTKALVQAGRFNYALALLDFREINEFVQTLARWALSFEQLEGGLSVTVLCEATSVARWLSPYWRKIHRVLSTSVS